jgi:hypothetical protein
VLVISQPSHAGLNPELKAFWDNETWRNRLIFLCGSETFTEVSRAAAYMKAAQDQVADFEAQRYADAQPEMQQARAALDRHNTAFRSALRETFTQAKYASDDRPGMDSRHPDQLAERHRDRATFCQAFVCG